MIYHLKLYNILSRFIYDCNFFMAKYLFGLKIQVQILKFKSSIKKFNQKKCHLAEVKYVYVEIELKFKAGLLYS